MKLISIYIIQIALTGSNDAVDAIVGFLLAPIIDDIRSFLAFTVIHQLDVRIEMRLEIPFVFGFHLEIFSNKYLVSKLQGDIVNILQKWMNDYFNLSYIAKCDFKYFNHNPIHTICNNIFIIIVTIQDLPSL
jgi:hypothetical protein